MARTIPVIAGGKDRPADPALRRAPTALVAGAPRTAGAEAGAGLLQRVDAPDAVGEAPRTPSIASGR
jgi:hypothetical protein